MRLSAAIALTSVMALAGCASKGAPVEAEEPGFDREQELATKLGVDAASIEVREAAAVVWNDGSLGCPRPGQVYTQAVEPGYRIILEYEGRQYDYRATERGYLFLCELPTLLQRPKDL